MMIFLGVMTIGFVYEWTKGALEVGLMANQTLVAQEPKGIIDPATGQPVGSRDPFFTEINDQLADKGFIVTASDDLIQWARTGSLMWMTFGLACCAVEMMQVSMPRYDVRALRLCAPRQPASVRRDDRGRYADQQNGPSAAQGLRPDAAGAALRYLYGIRAQTAAADYHYSYSVAPGCDRGGAGGHLCSPAARPSATKALLYGGLASAKKIRRVGTIERQRLRLPLRAINRAGYGRWFEISRTTASPPRCLAPSSMSRSISVS